ncbi:MAG TPA: HAD family hydrolase [Trueperaceae bacterium]|jgi:Cof subfamily protein (haloacid dehalogenase superfamily)
MLLAFDLDRTLVADDFTLPDDVADAISAARAAGHHVTVLTGRPLVAARGYLERLAVDRPYAVNHGSTILAPDGSLIDRKRLREDEVSAILGAFLADAELEFSCVVDDHIYVRDPAHERWLHAHAQGRVVARYAAGLELAADKVVFHANGRCAEVDAHVARSHPHLVRYAWGDGWLEVVPTGGDKGSALARIAELLDVRRDDVVAFGDGLNDVSMLSWAGHAVAVGPEAHPEALAVAHERVAAPEAGGVAEWLRANAL